MASGIGYCHDPIDIGKNITYNGRQFILTRNVTQGHAIAPVGDSHTGTRKYHLHISKIEAGGLGAFNSQTHSIDPWTSIITTPTTLTSRIRTRKPFVFSGNTSDHNRGTDNWGTIHLIYPNPDSTRNPLGRNVFQVEVEMENARIGSRYDRYDNVVMNLDIVRLEFRSPYTKNWQTILGSDYEGYFRINPLDSFTIYPSRINNEYYYIIIRESGIVPFAYRTAGDNIPGQSGSFTAGFHPRDYFLFSDIYPRIIKESTPNPTSPVLLADTPKRARYNDGKYFFRSKVFNIHNDSITSDSVS
ncbi:MAG: hypothetical protein IPM26_04745 [Saprospiraceae bacterium]|nr:hypothetical protein [Saprospiraceae bacterium]